MKKIIKRKKKKNRQAYDDGRRGIVDKACSRRMKLQAYSDQPFPILKLNFLQGAA